MEPKENQRINLQKLNNKMNEKEFLVAFINEKLDKSFASLNSSKHEDERLYNFIKRAINDLKEDPFCGIRIPKKQWPKEYINKYQITNLRKYDLPKGWRLIYTIETDEIKILSIILEWFNHKDYNKRFNYNN